MTIEELDCFIKDSLGSEDNLRDFIFLPPLENRLTDLLAARLNKEDTPYRAITEYPFKNRSINPTGKASLIDLVCFKKNDNLWSNEKILWALETKLYSPHHIKNQERYLTMSMGGPNNDREKLKNLKFGRFFILLYQFEIIRIPNIERSVKSILECYPLLRTYLGDSLKKINKKIENKELINSKMEALKKECINIFGEDKTIYNCSREIPVSEGDTEFLIKIHYIINEDSCNNIS